MSRRRPDPDQSLFPFVWSDEADARPDRPADDIDDDDAPPPLRERVRDHREGVANVTLWGEPLTVRRAPAEAPDLRERVLDLYAPPKMRGLRPGAYDRTHERRAKG